MPTVVMGDDGHASIPCDGVLARDLLLRGPIACRNASQVFPIGEPESSGFQWKPSSLINVTGDKAKSLFNLLDDLENDEDVQQVFSNFDIDDREIEGLV